MKSGPVAKLERRAVIFGGTHGNELTGVELVRHWMGAGSSSGEFVTNALISRSCSLQYILSNPGAVEVCRRYLDCDLNRCFLPQDLASQGTEYENKRAREIVREIGGINSAAQSFLIDLHTTTSNMGPTVILTTLDPFNLWVAARLSAALPGIRIISNELAREESPFVNALSPFGFCVEVGPVPQGVLSPKVLDQTREIVSVTLEALDVYFESGCTLVGDGILQEVPTFEYVQNLDYPRNKSGKIIASVHPERYAADFVPVEKGSPLFLGFDGRTEYKQEDVEIFWPIFIAEAAYVEKNCAMVLTKRIVRTWAENIE